jgi:rhamnose transport system ATP-binding protein
LKNLFLVTGTGHLLTEVDTTLKNQVLRAKYKVQRTNRQITSNKELKIMTESLLLRAENLSKSYAGVQALRAATFELRSGEVHALVGENGAGKSTLIKIITGAIAADSGEISLNEQLITNNSPRLAKSLGIAAIYQQPALFPELSVAENLTIGHRRGSLWKPINWRQRQRRATELLDQVGARIDPESAAGELSMPQQQLVEIARALGADARVLIMDEPTASLSEADTQNLFEVIRRLRGRGVGIIYISHRLDELPLIADRVTVLRDGCTIDRRQMADVNHQELIQLMVGRELSAVFPKREVELGETVLELRRLGCANAGVQEVTLSLRAGEIMGLAGLVGAGRTELARTLFGLTPADRGELLLRGTPVTINNPAKAVKLGLAYLPEDRRRHGVILDMPISANITLASLGEFSRYGALQFGREKRVAAEYSQRLGIKTPAIFAPVTTLSGGNQQKVALSRWLVTRPSILILDEPTQGIDVGAKSEIHALMNELAAQGVAILMISSELPEILGMSDRIAVMRGGTIVGILDRQEATQQGILALALGHGTDQPKAMNGTVL